MPKTKKFSLENDFFPGLIGKNFYGYCTDQEFMDIGTPERYASAKQKLQFKKLYERIKK
jgi:NDP-sugar pyrophosphorylase family protein